MLCIPLSFEKLFFVITIASELISIILCHFHPSKLQPISYPYLFLMVGNHSRTFFQPEASRAPLQPSWWLATPCCFTLRLQYVLLYLCVKAKLLLIALLLENVPPLRRKLLHHLVCGILLARCYILLKLIDLVNFPCFLHFSKKLLELFQSNSCTWAHTEFRHSHYS